MQTEALNRGGVCALMSTAIVAALCAWHEAKAGCNLPSVPVVVTLGAPSSSYLCVGGTITVNVSLDDPSKTVTLKLQRKTGGAWSDTTASVVKFTSNNAVSRTFTGAAADVEIEGVSESAALNDTRMIIDGGDLGDQNCYTEFTINRVDITEIDPECVCLDKNEKTKKDLTIKYKIEPPGYTATSAQVEILENGTVFKTLNGSSLSGTGQATLSSGEQLDSSKSYTARAVINGNCYSAETDLTFLGPWVIEDMTVGGADDECVPDGILMFCFNTLHESAVSVADEKIEFLAYSWGQDVEIGGVEIQIGGTCWAKGHLGGKYTQECDATKIKIIAECVLNGKVSASAAIVSFDGDIQLDGTSKNVFSTSDATYNNQTYFMAVEFDNITSGEHEIHVKFKGSTSAVGDGNVAATEFNDHYDDGYFIKVKEITIECEECSCD